MIDQDEMDKQIKDITTIVAIGLIIFLILAFFCSCSTPTEPEPKKFELKLHICGIDSKQCRDTTIN